MHTEEAKDYFSEPSIQLHKEGFTIHPPKDGLLPVQWHSDRIPHFRSSVPQRYGDKLTM